MIGEVNHGIEVQILAGVVIYLLENPVCVENGVVKISFFIDFSIVEMLEFCWIPVAIFDMAAHNVEDNEILFVRIYLIQELQQGSIMRRFLEIPVYPF